MIKKIIISSSMLFQDLLLASVANNALMLLPLLQPLSALFGGIVSLVFLVCGEVLSPGFANSSLAVTVLFFSATILFVIRTLTIDMSLRWLAFPLILSILFDVSGAHGIVSEVLNAEYRGYTSTGRVSGTSREPSYFSEYVFFVTLALLIRRKLIYAAILFVLCLFLARANTLLLYAGVLFVVCAGFYVWRAISGRGYFASTVYLVCSITLLILAMELTGFVDWSFDAQGSWRTISGKVALGESGFFPASLDDLQESLYQQTGALWIVSIYSFFPFVIYNFGFLLGGAFLLITVGPIIMRVSREAVSTLEMAIKITSTLIFLMFSPKWCFVILLTVCVDAVPALSDAKTQLSSDGDRE